jgi:hypothetical protein
MPRTAIRVWPWLGKHITFASGSFLQQRKQLGQWLRDNTTIPCVDNSPTLLDSLTDHAQP